MRIAWTKEQLSLLAWSMRHKEKEVDIEWLAAYLSMWGPPRTRTGVRAKRENLKHCLYLEGHRGLSNGNALDRTVMAVRIGEPARFNRYCTSLVGNARSWHAKCVGGA